MQNTSLYDLSCRNLKSCLISLAFILVLPGCGKHSKHLKKGDEYYKVKFYNEAIEEYTKAINAKNDFDTAYFKRAEAILIGSLRIDSGIPSYPGAMQSLADYDKAILLNPNYSKAYERRAFAKEQLSDIEGAYRDYSKVVELNPKYFKAYYLKGVTELTMKKFEAALHNFDKAVMLDTTFPNESLFPRAELFLTRGIVKYELGMTQEAMEDFNESYRRDEKWEEAMIWLGFCKLKLNDAIGGCLVWERMAKKGNSDAQSFLQEHCN